MGFTASFAGSSSGVQSLTCTGWGWGKVVIVVIGGKVVIAVVVFRIDRGN